MTPIQHWFFERIAVEPQQWNQSLLVTVSNAVGFERLKAAVNAVVNQHDVFGLRFDRADGTWIQKFEPPGDVAIARRQLASLSGAEQEREIEAVAKELNEGFVLTEGPLFAFAFFETEGGEPDRLLIVAHHLVVDAVSWSILLEDLGTACHQVVAGQPTRFPLNTTSFKAWSELQASLANAGTPASDHDYWKQHISKDEDVRLPLDSPGSLAGNTVAGSVSRQFQLEPGETEALLQDLPRRVRAQMNEALVAALARTLAEWTGRSILTMDLEGHGRDSVADNVDLSRTVGWLTTVYPMRLNLAGAQDPVAVLQAVKEQLRSAPERGASHGRLTYLATDQDVSGPLRSAPNAQLLFNYLGRMDFLQDAKGLLSAAYKRFGTERHPDGKRAYLIEVNAWVAEARLTVDWHHHSAFHRDETIDALGQRFLGELRALTDFSDQRPAQTAVPSDFPLANLDQDELSQLSQLLNQADRKDD